MALRLGWDSGLILGSEKVQLLISGERILYLGLEYLGFVTYSNDKSTIFVKSNFWYV